MNAHHKKSSYRAPPPDHRQHFSSSTSKLASSCDRSSADSAPLARAVNRVPYGWQLDITVPEFAAAAASPLIDQLKRDLALKARYQVVRGVNLADLLEPNFLNSYVRTGSLVALNLTENEEDDVFAIDGRGRLVLSVCKSTYEVLGLPGRASMHGSFRQRFVIEISLVDPAFRSGKPGFERVKKLLRNWPTETELFQQLQKSGSSVEGRTFDLVMSFVDQEGQPREIETPPSAESKMVEPSVSLRESEKNSIPSPGSFPLARVEPVAPQKRQRTSSGALRRPTNGDEEWWDSFKEWRGLAALGADASVTWRTDPDDDDDDEGQWGIERNDSEPGRVSILSLNGLLHPKSLNHIVETIVNDPSFSSLPFISIQLRPFPHSPISHTSKQSLPVVGTAIRPNGKKRKRGRGRGEEEEADPDRVRRVGGWDLVVRPGPGDEVSWWLWEGQ